MCVRACVCVSVREREGEREGKGRREALVVRVWGNGALPYCSECVFGALKTSRALKARWKVKRVTSWISPVGRYRASAAVTLNPFALCQPQLESPCPAAVPASKCREGKRDSRGKEAERD